MTKFRMNILKEQYLKIKKGYHLKEEIASRTS